MFQPKSALNFTEINETPPVWNMDSDSSDDENTKNLGILDGNNEFIMSTGLVVACISPDNN